MLRKLIAATTPVATVPRARDRLNVLHDDWDEDIERLIVAATGVVERETRTALQPSTWEYRADYWWTGWDGRIGWCRQIEIPLSPVRTVESVKYLDVDGAEQTVDPVNWYFDRTPEGANLNFVSGWSAPTLYDRPNAVRVRFTAGYDDPNAASPGSDSELTLPAEAELAVLFLVGHWLENRESVLAEQRFDAPQSFRHITSQLKVYR